MKANTSTKIPVLSIAGSDCSGGAGIQADLKTFSAHGLFGMSVILSVVAENTARVISVHNVPNSCVRDQLDAVFEDIPPAAVKVGMIGSLALMKELKEAFENKKMKNVVIDPVMFAKNGAALMDVKNCEYFKENLLKYADILTPNIPEAQYLCGFEINTIDDMKKAALTLHEAGAAAVLIKGGHAKDLNACDVLYDGHNFHFYTKEKIDTKNTHGTGCTLSSAIAANLAKQKPLSKSVRDAKDYVFKAILNSLDLGSGSGPTNHFYKGYENDTKD